MSRDMENIERIRAGPAQGGKSPDQMSPQELHAVLWEVLTWRDSVVKKISKMIEAIPGLGPLLEKLMDSISGEFTYSLPYRVPELSGSWIDCSLPVFVLTTLEPFLKPILKTASAGLANASGEVINTHDQYEVFNDPIAVCTFDPFFHKITYSHTIFQSDPTHSFLSKDHFVRDRFRIPIPSLLIIIPF